MVVWLSTTGAPRQDLRGRLGGLFPHVVGACLNPGGVDNAVHDGVGVNAGAEVLVPVLLLILGV